MSENLILIGFVVIFIGILLIIVGSLGKGEIKFGFGGFIGPIPFGWANDAKMLWLIIIISVVLIMLFIKQFI